MTPFRYRRLLCGAIVALPSMQVLAAQRHYAVLALVGNRIEVVQPQEAIGSNLDRNRRHVLEDASGSFDRYASAGEERVLKRVAPDDRVTLLSMPPSSLHDQPEKLFDGKQVGLPGAVVDAIERGRISHVILLTKYRGDMRAPLLNTATGIGKVRGVGYYVDSHSRLTNVESGRSGAGFLAPFVSIRATLVSGETGDILRDELIEGAETHSNAARDSDSNPWDMFSAEEKISRLRRLLERQLDRVIPELLSGR
jgi:hypothetical protein